MTEDEDASEVFVCQLTAEEYEALADGEGIYFEYPGGIIESDPVVVVELEDTPDE